MGESLTPAHMSLFGYARKTAPLLETLRADKDFIYQPGIASGVDMSRPNFVVLHQRNSHSPYDRNYPPEGNYFHSDAGSETNQYRVDTYDNSVRHTDHLLYNLINDLKSRSRLPVYVLFTSDHGEMLGEKDGQFGHGRLMEAVARVPFIFYAHNGDPAQISAGGNWSTRRITKWATWSPASWATASSTRTSRRVPII